MDIKEAVLAGLKELILPELDRIKEENREIKASLILTNKRLDDMNMHLVDQSRRIDDVNKRIDDVNKRIDDLRVELKEEIEETRREITETNRRIDRLYEVIVRREEHERLEIRIIELENRVNRISSKLAISE